MPRSPFDTLTDNDNTNANTGSDTNKDASSSSLSPIDREKDRDSGATGMFDDDQDDIIDEDMPFAWTQNENTMSSFVSNTTTQQPIAQMCAAPPPLVSFVDGPLQPNGIALATAINTQLHNYKEFREIFVQNE